MNNFRLKDLVLMGLSLAIMIVIGKILYAISLTLPIPSSRVFMTAPVFSFIFTATILRTKKIGTVSLLSLCYSIYMLRFSFFAFLAGFLSGVIVDIITLIIFKNYYKPRNIYLSVPLKSSISIWTSFFVVNLFVPNSRFVQFSIIPMILITIVVYIIGLLSSKYAIRIFEKRFISI